VSERDINGEQSNLLLAVRKMEKRLGERSKMLIVEVAGTPNAKVGGLGEIVGIVGWKYLDLDRLDSDEEEKEMEKPHR
jgi:hypothetical protein